ncbi:MAG: hypothetical protein GF310_04550 [candidate division Zixibacteria bacterium]|nr:hypothetical protein [candidate division Zixibacteria bacterium]
MHAQQNASNDPHAISGEKFDYVMDAQNVELQDKLEMIFSESEGYLVTGPLCQTAFKDSTVYHCGHVRIICPGLELYKKGVQLADSIAGITAIEEYSSPIGAHYLFEKYFVYSDYDIDTFKIETINSFRFDIDLNKSRLVSRLINDNIDVTTESDIKYQHDHYIKYDMGKVPEKGFFYDIPYIIEGYQNYKDYLYSYAEIDLEFIKGVTAFIPTEETLQWFKDNAPQEAYPNKEEAKLREEYHDFFERGGDLRIMQTLTREGFDTLQSGEYFFAVSPSYEIRFGRELLREEVERIEEETGKKVPRANHAFLFPGEYVLTAGAFWIDTESENRLVRVNAQSGHYFYSNVTPTIREDIAERSDHYLTTLGHFFKALDSLQIPYENILISKLQ